MTNPGVGKTTSSVNLRAVLAGTEDAVRVVDMDGPLPERYTGVRLAVGSARADLAGVAINAAVDWNALPVEVHE